MQQIGSSITHLASRLCVNREVPKFDFVINEFDAETHRKLKLFKESQKGIRIKHEISLSKRNKRIGEYNKKHREMQNKANQKYYYSKKGQEKIKKYRQTNKERINEYNRQYYLKNSDRIKERERLNREKRKQNNENIKS